MEMEEICFEMICHVGEARSSFIEAIQAVKKGDYRQAQALMEIGKESYNLGHRVHAGLVQAEMNGTSEALSLILVHAEDQLMSAENFKILSEEFIEIYQRLENIQKTHQRPLL